MTLHRPWNLPITAAQAMERLRYCPDSGTFFWRDKPQATVGWVDGEGYLRIGLLGSDYHAHKLAWLIAKGVLPSGMIDHKNGDKTDNRILNLRLATTAQNCWNRRTAKHNTSGKTGVHFDRASNKWKARICAHGVRTSLGKFARKSDAIAARASAEREIYSGFAPVEEHQMEAAAE